MFGPTLRGEKCTLRPPRKEEAQTYRSCTQHGPERRTFRIVDRTEGHVPHDLPCALNDALRIRYQGAETLHEAEVQVVPVRREIEEPVRHAGRATVADRAVTDVLRELREG